MIHEAFIAISVIAGVAAIISSYYFKLRQEEKFKRIFFLSILTSIIIIPSIISLLARSVFGDRGLAVLPSIASTALGLTALIVHIKQ